MTTDFASPPIDGGHRSLRLFPGSEDTMDSSPRRQPILPNFDSFHLAFQQATGWELRWRPRSEPSPIASPFYRAHEASQGELEIIDMSRLIPPGLTPISRIYCENLICELNKVLAELTGLEANQSAGESAIGSSRPKWPSAIPEEESSPIPVNAAYHTTRVAVTPLAVNQRQATCEWYVQPDGTVRFLAMAAGTTSKPMVPEMIAARATFLAECRHRTDDLTVKRAVQNTAARMFPAKEDWRIITGTINPLMGDVCLMADEGFQIDTCSAAVPRADINSGTQIYLYVPRDSHLIISFWSLDEDQDRIRGWMEATARRLQKLQPDELEDAFQSRIHQTIPSLPSHPDLALAISRC